MNRSSGQIIILNGAPRAGKSSISREIAGSFEGLWLNLGVDTWMAATPERFRPGIGLRPGGERPDLEPVLSELMSGLVAAIAAQSRMGLNVVADLGVHDDHAQPLGLREMVLAGLAGLPLLTVGVRCPVETIMARRNADPQDGYYAGGALAPEPVVRWQEQVHAGWRYDLDVDTSVLTPAQCAALIKRALGA